MSTKTINSKGSLSRTPRGKLRTGFAIHGGAGVLPKQDLSSRRKKQYIETLERILLRGHRILRNGGSSLDAVETAVKMLEDSPLFNAGKGSAMTAERGHELDASIMEGSNLRAGAVALLRHVKNPIALARLVMEKSPHLMLAGEGAEKFAKLHGVQLVEQEYFFTQRRLDALERLQARERKLGQKIGQEAKLIKLEKTSDSHGTVGAVALDQRGRLAAAASTGGMTNKSGGRVGDTPIIGAGIYANQLCAISCTGWGEYFIRLSAARDIAALMEYCGRGIQEAVDTVIQTKLKTLGGQGGAIAVDRFGNVGISIRSRGMYRAYINAEGEPRIGIYAS